MGFFHTFRGGREFSDGQELMRGAPFGLSPGSKTAEEECEGESSSFFSQQAGSSKLKNAQVNKRGFTLLELIIVMVILAIVGSIAYGAFQRIAINANLKTAAREIAGDFALLKQRAMAEDTMYQLILDVHGNSYSLERCTNPGTPCDGWTTIQSKTLSSGERPGIGFVAGSTTVTNFRFLPRGIVINGGTETALGSENIELFNIRDSRAVININITGRTNVAFNMQ